MDLEHCYVSTDVTRPLVTMLETGGIAPAAIREATGLDAAAFSAPDDKVPIPAELRLWDFTAAALAKPNLGFDLAGQFDLRHVGVVGYLCLQQPTLWDMLTTYSQYHRLLHDVATLTPVRSPTGDGVEHYFTRDGGGPGKHAGIYTLAVTHRVLTQAAIGPLTLRQVGFQHMAPRDDTPYLEYFGREADLRFGAPINSLTYSSGDFETRIAHHDSALAEILREHADRALAAHASREDLVNQIKQELSSALNRGQLGIDAMAKKLGLSRRTLQRRLDQIGLTFREVVQDMRQDLAFSYLRDARLSLAEIAFLLGYSEPAAFSNAFKGWTGQSPRNYREHHFPADQKR